MQAEVKEYQRCRNCVMDTTDEGILFDEYGVCDLCQNYTERVKPYFHPDEQTKSELMAITKIIQEKGKDQKYDCILGFSGGVDSSYLAYIAKEILHLRPLLYVVDTGWNLPIAADNIERVSKQLNLDVVTEVVNWDEMKDLQLSFLKSQIVDQDLPQDHAIFAGLYNYAVKNGFKYVLTGANTATECIVPGGGLSGGNDIVMLKDIHNKFGKIELKTFPLCGMFKYKLYYGYLRGMKRVAPLNYLPFDQQTVETFLAEKFGWRGYENKHYENLFTRWYEGYYLYHKFAYDKRITYFSNLILSGSMSRDEALEKLENPPYPIEQAQKDTASVAEKLGITIDELIDIVNGENKSSSDYKNSKRAIILAKKIAVAVGIEKRFPKR